MKWQRAVLAGCLWGGLLVSYGADAGLACGDPEAGDCFVPHGTPFCSDMCDGTPCNGCCDAVCKVDGWCCNISWDPACADLAQEICAAPCPWDCQDGGPDGNVGINDFLSLLGQWGVPGACDFDGGGVGITDFLKLLGAWGPCP
jgi:hypothetical protein